MIAYAIKVKDTVYYLPHRNKSRGFSYDEPIVTNSPRLFWSLRSAQNALTAWCQGIFKLVNSHDEYGDDYYIDVTTQPHRKRENMEIVKFRLKRI